MKLRNKFTLPLLAALVVLALVLVLVLSGRSSLLGVGAVTAEEAVLHTKPDADAASDIHLTRDSLVSVQKRQGDWLGVVFDGMEGYLRADQVQLNTALPQMDATGRITEKATVYVGPGRTYGKLDQAEAGDILSVTGYEDGWFQVIRNGAAGYVSADALALQLTAGQLQMGEAPIDGENDPQQDPEKEPENNPQQEPEKEPEKEPENEPDKEPEKDPQQPAVTLPASNTSVLAAGVVNSSGVRIRTGPSTDYDIITETVSGTVLSVLGWKDGWYKVNYDHKTGYMRADFVELHSTTTSLHGYAIVNGTALNLRSTASTSGSILATLESGTCLDVVGFQKGWYQVSCDGKAGYVSGDYVTPTMTKPTPPPVDEGGSTGGDTAGDEDSGNTGSTGDSELGAQIAAYAQTFLGKPYVLGGAGPDTFDCSGLIQYVYKHFGYSLPRVTNSQYTCGTAVGKSELQPGDLIFFYNPKYGSGPTTHAGIYIGDGKFIHATSYTYSTGTVSAVQIHPLSNSYYAGIYVGARRIIG